MDSRGGQAWEKGHRKTMKVWLAVAPRGSVICANLPGGGYALPGLRTENGRGFVRVNRRTEVGRGDRS